jgi:hypothetical protein
LGDKYRFDDSQHGATSRTQQSPKKSALPAFQLMHAGLRNNAQKIPRIARKLSKCGAIRGSFGPPNDRRQKALSIPSG